MARTRRANDLLSEAAARELADRVLAMSPADETEVSVGSGWTGNTRSAVNRITTAGEVENTSVSVTARFGRREASTSTNRLDEEGLRTAAEAAADLARLAPENPELMPLLGPQEYAGSDGFHEATANLGPAERGRIAADAIAAATDGGDLAAAGFLTASASAGAIANSAGMFAYHRSTSVDYELTVRTADGTGSGWAGVAHRDRAALDIPSMHASAVRRALDSQNPTDLQPGDYPVVFTAHAVSDIVGLLSGSLGARSADEGRSAFSAEGEGTKVGEKLLDEKFQLGSDPVGLGSSPWQGDGMPLQREVWFRDGVLEQLSYDRYWADRQGVRPTGRPGSLRMGGGDASIDDLVRGLDGGLLVTRLYYIRSIDPRTILYTGLTRDGVFWVENGEIVRPVNNFRWNDSPLTAFASIEELGRPVRISSSREVPPARLSSFHFSTVSEAV
ncbi:MAG TPA: TldD/PmbA family protein [Gemmatimonadota bacterium]|nr:TldD/PmbA family protein [Gemmatimonadota bacterium]